METLGTYKIAKRRTFAFVNADNFLKKRPLFVFFVLIMGLTIWAFFSLWYLFLIALPFILAFVILHILEDKKDVIVGELVVYPDKISIHDTSKSEVYFDQIVSMEYADFIMENSLLRRSLEVEIFKVTMAFPDETNAIFFIKNIPAVKHVSIDTFHLCMQYLRMNYPSLHKKIKHIPHHGSKLLYYE